MAIPDVEILAVRLFTVCFRDIRVNGYTFQVVENLRGQGRRRGLKVVKSSS